MKIDGNCFCGHIKYEAEIDPAKVVICHCTDCQTHSGTAYGVVVGIVNEQFRLVQGTLKTSGMRHQDICPNTGGQLHILRASCGYRTAA